MYLIFPSVSEPPMYMGVSHICMWLNLVILSCHLTSHVNFIIRPAEKTFSPLPPHSPNDVSSLALAGELFLPPTPTPIPEGRLAWNMGTESSFPAWQLDPDVGADAPSQGGQTPRHWQGPQQLPIASKAVKRK